MFYVNFFAALFIFTFMCLGSRHASGTKDVPFQLNYKVTYSPDHTQLLNRNEEIVLSIDEHSGTGFRSIERYGSGFFGIKLKIPAKKTTGIITTFYLISQPNYDEQRHEVDFEFLVTDTQHYVLSTNVISNGNLHREQQFALWFDPTTDFHFYQILWNRHQLVLFVDGTPIRVLKNDPSIQGIFPTKPMEIQGTIWNATWGSQGKGVNWSQGPFQAYYQGFGIDGCSANLKDPQECYGLNYEWNRKELWALNQDQQKAYEHVRKKYLTYNYCTKTNSATPECKINY